MLRVNSIRRAAAAPLEKKRTRPKIDSVLAYKSRRNSKWNRDITVCKKQQEENIPGLGGLPEIIQDMKEFPAKPRDDLIARYIHHYTESNGFANPRPVTNKYRQLPSSLKVI